MKIIKPAFYLMAVLIVINLPPELGLNSNLDLDTPDNSEFQDALDFSENISNPVPPGSKKPEQTKLPEPTWPPLKSGTSTRCVIVEFETVPVGQLKGRLDAAGFDVSYRAEKLTLGYLQLEQQHRTFKNLLFESGIMHELLWDYYNVFNGISLILDAKDVPTIEKMPMVKAVYYDMPGSGALDGTVKIVGADKAWNLKNSTGFNLKGDGVVVAVIDTGIDYYHNDLGGGPIPNGKVIGGYDFVNKDNDPMDESYHGTMVSGIIAAKGAVNGIAPNATLLAYKVSEETNNAWKSDTIAGLDRAVDPDGVPATDDAADIICISLSWLGTPYDEISRAVDNAHAAGSLTIVAGGNNGPDTMTIRSPGTAVSALTVGASTDSDILAGFSSRGPVGFGHIKPEIIAPGVDVYTTYPAKLGSLYGELTGTSASGPHVAGAAALLKQQHPDWGPDELKSGLVNNARDISEHVIDQGAGRLDVLKSVQAGLMALPDILAFEAETGGVVDTTTLEKITLTNYRTGQIDGTIKTECFYSADTELLELETPQSVQGYITPSSSSFSVPASGTAEIDFQLTVPGGAQEGYYWGTIEFLSPNDNLTVPFGFRHLTIDSDKGEWLVDKDTKLTDQKIKISNLTVVNGAKLELSGVSVFVASVKDGQSKISITKGSSLILDNCIIAAYNPSIYYNFTLNGRGTIRGSSLSGMWGIFEAPYPGGISIYSNGSSVTNSSVFRGYTNGIFAGPVDDLQVVDNYVHHNGGEGVLLWRSTNVGIYRNNFTKNWWDGIGMTGTDAVVLDNEVYHNSYDGIWVNMSSPYIEGNNISATGIWDKHYNSAAMKFQRGSKPIIRKNNLLNNKYYGFYINGSSPVIYDTTAKSSREYDVFITYERQNISEPRFINSTYDTVKFSGNDHFSELSREWYLSAEVVDEKGLGLESVDVKLFNVTGNTSAVLKSNKTGFTPQIPLVQYTRDRNGKVYSAPYKLEASRSSLFKTTISDIQLDSNEHIKAELPIPDLSINGFWQEPEVAFAGGKITFTFEIQNRGSIAIQDVDLTCRLEGYDTPLAEFYYAELEPDEIKNISFSRTIYESGPQVLTIELSTLTNIFESDYFNNHWNHTFFTYQKPDVKELEIDEDFIYVHETVTFKASASVSQGNITGYQFNFSDGTVSAWQENNTFVHVFSNESFSWAVVRIRTDKGVVSNWSAPIWFDTIERLASTGIAYEPASGGNITTTFSFSPSAELQAVSNLISDYHWTFGDGVTSLNATPAHKYQDDGSYTVTLKIKYSTDGAEKMFETIVKVNNIRPTASFFTSTEKVFTITFDASSTIDIDDDMDDLTFSWQFGDGSSGSGMVVTHTYDQEDLYLVVLIVRDDDGAVSEYRLELLLRDPGSVVEQEPDQRSGTGEAAVLMVGIMGVILIACLIFLTWVRRSKAQDDDEESMEDEE